MTLGAPLLSITRNADEWLEYSNDNVTLLLSLTKNVFNGDTECYATLILTVVVLRTVTEFHVTLSIATDVPLSFHVTLR